MAKTNPNTYGNSLATNVAVYLEKGGVVAYAHRDYCGMGLIYDADKQKFVYGSVFDGNNFYPEKVFDNRKDFIKWLADQSDESLSGKELSEFDRNNQRITRARLKDLEPIDPEERAQIGVVWAS
ncbi:MAG TPA: hypothetical protein DCM08_06270 [Microscillaceae bacterium]|jgi:hypothetical protein|nr:hypothetical protein [Microscillaceae bacterium]